MRGTSQVALKGEAHKRGTLSHNLAPWNSGSVSLIQLDVSFLCAPHPGAFTLDTDVPTSSRAPTPVSYLSSPKRFSCPPVPLWRLTPPHLGPWASKRPQLAATPGRDISLLLFLRPFDLFGSTPLFREKPFSRFYFQGPCLFSPMDS